MLGRARIPVNRVTPSHLITLLWLIGIGRSDGSITSSYAVGSMEVLHSKSPPANGSLPNRSMGYGPVIISASSPISRSRLEEFRMLRKRIDTFLLHLAYYLREVMEILQLLLTLERKTQLCFS